MIARPDLLLDRKHVPVTPRRMSAGVAPRQRPSAMAPRSAARGTMVRRRTTEANGRGLTWFAAEKRPASATGLGRVKTLRRELRVECDSSNVATEVEKDLKHARMRRRIEISSTRFQT